MKRMAAPIGWLHVLTILIMLSAACGGDPRSLISQGPVSASVIITDVQVSADGDKVEVITIRTDEGKEISLRLGEDIDLEMWRPQHMLSHVGLGKSLGLKIGVTYIRTSGTMIVTELSE
jgi:hypothetical protein